MFKNFKKNPFFSEILIKKNLFLTIFSILPAVFASLLEGLSYAFLLLAVNVLRGDTLNLFNFLLFFKRALKDLSTNRQFLIFLLAGLFVQLFRSFFLFLSQYMTSLLSIRLTHSFQKKIYTQIFSFSYNFVSKYQVGNLQNYNTSTTIIPNILTCINNSITAITMGLISLVWLIKIDATLTSFLIVFFFCVNLFYKILLKKLNKFSISLSKDNALFASKVTQGIHGLKLIHIFFKQKSILDSFDVFLKKIALNNSKISFWRSMLNSFGEIIGILVLSLLLIVGAFILHNKEAFLAYLLIYIFIAYRFATRLQIFMDNLGVIVASKGPLLRLKSIISSEKKEYIPTGGINLSSFNNSIAFSNVSFKYPGRNKFAIENFSFEFKKNKTYALVGTSGAGKSTLMDLLLRLYDVEEGKIYINNLPLKDLSISSIRNLIGVVCQDTFLFHDTIKNNLLFANPNATEDEIFSACKKAFIHDFIMKLPKKYESMVGEKGHKISGGERQRIALARGLLKKPEILILDEATSQLDSHSEKQIQSSIQNLKNSKTLIIIAHRLSTIAHADEILVLNKGTLIENGSHESLIEKKGEYYKFWSIQSQKHTQYFH
ncbi:MAG: Heterocyst differentiation ATP-binding protein HepA [Candidatus Anoxychlamydiales bacterium]|nr:Heterocyst differentiation ATP-binding protein HepA [Candidatus Anoxychlamydiales bacterium]